MEDEGQEAVFAGLVRLQIDSHWFSTGVKLCRDPGVFLFKDKTTASGKENCIDPAGMVSAYFSDVITSLSYHPREHGLTYFNIAAPWPTTATPARRKMTLRNCRIQLSLDERYSKLDASTPESLPRTRSLLEHLDRDGEITAMSLLHSARYRKQRERHGGHRQHQGN